MITHTLIDKCNTLLKDSEKNTGLNPVAELNMGNTVSRILLYADLNKIKQKVSNGEINVNNLTHVLKMTNCGSVNLPLFKEDVNIDYTTKKRAASFDIIAFKIPFGWDEGRGFDYHGDNVIESHAIISTDGSNWFQAKNGVEWDECGVYNNSTLLYNDDLIIGRQHFDYGTENLEIDITNYINEVLADNSDYYGIGLAFDPSYEQKIKENRFISFFSNHTNTFFFPYIETVNSEIVADDRANFHIGVNNRLYFFVIDNGEYINLDYLPSCVINEKIYDVKQSGKGCYYIDITLKNNEIEPYTILCDKWSNLSFNGELLDDVEMEFVALPLEKRITLGKINNDEHNCTPQLSGILNKEQVKIGDIREVAVDFIKDYSYGEKVVPSLAEYKIYVKENDRIIDVYPYQQIERKFTEHSFIINSNEMIPNTYYIDIRIKQGQTLKHFEKVLEFSIASNVTNYYK